MSHSKRLLLLLVVLTAGVGCDQSTKALATAHLSAAAPMSFLSGTMQLQIAHNEGAFLSLGESLPRPWRLAILRGGVGVMLLALFGCALFAKSEHPPFILGLALVLAGGTSNLVDRFVHEGYVVDFIRLGVGPLRTGIFNVADVAITAGILMVLVPGSRRPPKWTPPG